MKHCKSLISNIKQCYFCGAQNQLHGHHVFNGNPGRKLSEQYGCWVWLGVMHHTGKWGVHLNQALDDELKRECQLALMEAENWTTQEFREVFGKNYA